MDGDTVCTDPDCPCAPRNTIYLVPCGDTCDGLLRDVSRFCDGGGLLLLDDKEEELLLILCVSCWLAPPPESGTRFVSQLPRTSTPGAG